MLKSPLENLKIHTLFFHRRMVPLEILLRYAMQHAQSLQVTKRERKEQEVRLRIRITRELQDSSIVFLTARKIIANT